MSTSKRALVTIAIVVAVIVGGAAIGMNDIPIIISAFAAAGLFVALTWNSKRGPKKTYAEPSEEPRA